MFFNYKQFMVGSPSWVGIPIIPHCWFHEVRNQAQPLAPAPPSACPADACLPGPTSVSVLSFQPHESASPTAPLSLNWSQSLAASSAFSYHSLVSSGSIFSIPELSLFFCGEGITRAPTSSYEDKMRLGGRSTAGVWWP